MIVQNFLVSVFDLNQTCRLAPIENCLNLQFFTFFCFIFACKISERKLSSGKTWKMFKFV